MPWMAGGRRNERLAWRVVRPASRPATQGLALQCGVHNPQRAPAAASARRIMIAACRFDQCTGAPPSCLHNSMMQGAASAAAGPNLPHASRVWLEYSLIAIHAKLNCKRSTILLSLPSTCSVPSPRNALPASNGSDKGRRDGNLGAQGRRGRGRGLGPPRRRGHRCCEAAVSRARGGHSSPAQPPFSVRAAACNYRRLHG